MEIKCRTYLIGLLTSVFLVSCQSDEKKIFRRKNAHPASILQNQLFFSDRSMDYSFPLWFNDSLIRANGIESITRNLYSRNTLLPVSGDSIVEFPSESIFYQFNANGYVSRVSHISYFDDRKISQFDFFYSKSPNKNGFSAVKIDSMVEFKDNIPVPLSASRDLEMFALYDQKQSNIDFSVFQNRMSGDYLFAIHNKKMWGVLNVDKEFHPTPKDKILLGTMLKPEKIYRVQNKVNETEVVEYHYKKGSISKIVKNEYPFIEQRSFNYDKRGYCIGFVDSTFSDKQFLTRSVAKFVNNMHSSPTRIVFQKEMEEGKMKIVHYEDIIYKYRK